MMGAEFGQQEEWKFNGSLDWHLLDYAPHQGIADCVRDLNKLYRNKEALHGDQFSASGFEWISYDDHDNSVIVYLRKAGNKKVLVICNMTPVPRENYRIGLPDAGNYSCIFNSDDEVYGGSGHAYAKVLTAEQKQWQGRKQSAEVQLVPLGVIVYEIVA